MFIDEAIKEYQDGTFEVDGVVMTLTQRKEGGAVFEGVGHVRCGANWNLVFKLVAPDWTDPISLRTPRVGEFSPEEVFYDLRLTDINGTIWKSERIKIRFEQSDSGKGVILSGALRFIEALETVDPKDAKPDNYFIGAHFFIEHKIPVSHYSETVGGGRVLDKAEFSACGYEFEVRTRERSGETVIRAWGDTAFPTKFDKRLEEAFQFLIAKTALIRAWSKRTPEGSTLRLIAPSFNVADTQFHPPIVEAHWLGHSVDAWGLFGDYLGYILKTQKHYWNPVAFHLWNARETAFASIDARAVGVAVAVDAVCSLVGNHESDITKEKTRELRKQIISMLEERGEEQQVINRINGLLGTLRQKGTKKVLSDLADQGYLQKEYVEAWGDLRNKYVHPEIEELEPPTEEKERETILNTYKCEVLLYQLIMHLIGYEGPFTDYGADGYPCKTYPLA